ncbi:MAG: endonuclease [Streptosporangiales bacterium]|nr:endonuclease [Streptosporangiales bacterium]
MASKADTRKKTVRRLLDEAGDTYAAEAGITLKDQPAPLWRLLVLSNLLSARIGADIAVAAARELFKAGGGTPKGMAELTWQQRVDALGRGHYVRYDESTATRLGECAERVRAEYRGDLRRLPGNKEHDERKLREALQEFKGIGPTGVDIFCREVQLVWPWLRPYLDKVALKGAATVDLPDDPERLADLVTGKDMARLAAALVRASRDKEVAQAVGASSS